MKTKKNYSTNKNKKLTKRIVNKSKKKSKKSIKRTSITKKKRCIIGGNPKNAIIPIENTPISRENASINKPRYIPPHLRNISSVSDSTRNIESKPKSKPKSYKSRQYVSGDLDNNAFIEIRPYPLNASTLQYMCNNNKISIDTNGDVKCDPGLVVNVSDNKKAKVHKFSREMIDLWEDETTTKTYIEDNTFYNHVKEKDDISDKYSVYTTQDITYFRDLVETLKSGKYENTDLQFTDYNIIKDVGEYKIVGYPDPKHLGPILANSEFMAEYKNIADAQIRNSNDEIVKLYNVFGNNVRDVSELLLYIDESKKYLESILTASYISEGEKTETRTKIIKYQDKIKEMVPTIFNKPNIRIRYIFHILKGDDNMILSVKELTKEHKKILEQVQFLIDTEIPKKFHIDKPSFNSYYEYGDYFHIETEYIHPTTRLDTFSYLFQKRISLNELIYSCSIMVGDYKNEPFWSKLKFTYPNKEYNLSTQLTKKTGGGEYNIDLKDSVIIICNLLTSFDTEIYYRKGNDIFYLLLSANIESITPNKLDLSSGKLMYSVAGKKVYLMKGVVSYKVVKYYKIDETKDNPFKIYWYIPTVEHTGIFKMPLDDYYPIVSKEIYKNKDLKNSEIIKEYQLFNYTDKTNNYDIVAVLNDNIKYTVWVFNEINPIKNENRLKNIYDITNYKLLEEIDNIVDNLPNPGISSSDKLSAYINMYSMPKFDSLHIQAVNNTYYNKTTNITGIRLTRLVNVINKLKLNPLYYKKYKPIIKTLGILLYQFISI
jgi:hypothetical protein